ncbi:MAG: hypothetical protein JO318_20270 [Chloroflexi bacterium]|nr:hypothetical protein [Chloroflexota bacterium]MBV9135054.1 hypothetical protein [Chloroflexota bacterium]
MSDSVELVARLMAADGREREALLRETDSADLAAAFGVLGHRREIAAAEILALVDEAVSDRGLRKTARRELHRLRSMGIEPPAVTRTSPEPATEGTPRTLEIAEAWATDIDPGGSRAIWLLANRPLGGAWFAALLLNDQTGLQDMSLVDTTRKRYQREFEAARRGGGVWVTLPGDYGLRLIREALDLSRELGGGPPARYQAFREVFGEAPGPPERGLVFETISPVEINFNPGWLDESTRLLGEPEVAGWYVPVPADLRSRALEVARAPSAGLLVPGHTPEQQAMQLVADAAREAFSPVVRRGLRRRLEETGYIFLQTDRLGVARLAAAAARALDDGGLSPERHPFARMLLAAGLARLVGGETVGSRRAPEVLLELVGRAADQQAQGGPVETRPSGLILPR